MPRTIPITPALAALISSQDGVIAWEQLAVHGMTPSAVQGHVRRGEWQRFLPGVILTHGGPPTRRQRLIAAQLWAGQNAAIDGASACHYYGLVVDAFDPAVVHVAAPFGSSARTRDWVKVRRSIGEIRIAERGFVSYVPRPTAVLVAARGARTEKSAIAILSRAVQTGVVSVSDLAVERGSLGDKWCRRLDQALLAVGVGIRSAAERDAQKWIESSQILPAPLWNQWIDLGDGGSEVCPDALFVEAGMFHAINGKKYHAWGWQFEATHVTVERMTAAGLLPSQATAMRWRRDGAAALASVEQIYRRNAGRGMPPNVRLVDPPPWLVSRGWPTGNCA